MIHKLERGRSQDGDEKGREEKDGQRKEQFDRGLLRLLFGPLASNMTKMNEAEMQYFQVLRLGVISFIKGCAPILAVEFARRSIPAHLRPSFQDMEKAVKGGGAS